MILSVMALGLLIGMQHALEADHVAAVASLVSRGRGVRGLSRHGAVWGLGHTVTLLVVAGSALLLHLTVGPALAAGLELAVGLMLVLLGTRVLWLLWADRVHVHAHSHDGRTLHLHVHSHRAETTAHDPGSHRHAHVEGLPWRTFVVGLMHGMAGSAALIVLTATTMEQPLLGLVHILAFGVGSILGMAAFSAVLAVPLTYTARSLVRVNRALQLAIGVGTVGIGLATMVGSGRALLT